MKFNQESVKNLAKKATMGVGMALSMGSGAEVAIAGQTQAQKQKVEAVKLTEAQKLAIELTKIEAKKKRNLMILNILLRLPMTKMPQRWVLLVKTSQLEY